MKSHLQIYLAPFQGITGPTYREVYSSHFPQIDKLYTPFFTNVHRQKSLTVRAKELEINEHNGIPVVPQILSKDAEEIIRFGNHCYNKGFEEINWNLGCPFPRVAAKKRGSGILPYPEMVDEILEKVVSELPLKFSIKCRLGYESPDEILSLMPVFNRYRLSELIIHARVGKQIYKGGVNIASFKKAFYVSQNPVIYNGDIFSLNDYQCINEKLGGMNTWMIGRGLLVDPFLPADIKDLRIGDNEERKRITKKFVDDLYYAYRKKMNDRMQAINVLKELWEYMAFSFDYPQKVFSLIKKTKSFDFYEDAVNKVFEEFNWLGSASAQFNSNSM